MINTQFQTTFTGVRVHNTQMGKFIPQTKADEFRKTLESEDSPLNYLDDLGLDVDILAIPGKIGYRISKQENSATPIAQEICDSNISPISLSSLISKTIALILKQKSDNQGSDANQLLAATNHDLRNPLTAIAGYANLLLSDASSLTESQTFKIKQIEDATARMHSLLEDISEFTKIKAGKAKIYKEPASIKNLYDLSSKFIKPLAEKKNITLEFQATSDVAIINVDSNKFTRVLENLLSNAVKYSNPGTTVSVKAKKQGDQLVISVKDQGLGIPEKELSKLFKPFGKTSVTPTANESSTGLGLCIAKDIVEMHGGSITVESEVGKGTEFIISIPAE